MATDAIAAIRAAEQAAAVRIADARQQATARRQVAEQDAGHLLAVARARSQQQAAERRRAILAAAEAEALAIRQQGQAEMEALQQRLLRSTEEAAARIVAAILP